MIQLYSATRPQSDYDSGYSSPDLRQILLELSLLFVTIATIHGSGRAGLSCTVRGTAIRDHASYLEASTASAISGSHKATL
jgi:hypothetical protein